MKTLAACLALLSFSPLHSQTPVDRLVRALDSLSLTSYSDWRMSPDLKSYRPQGDPTSAAFDDSQWQILRLNESVYPDSCWLRKEIVLPEKILGRPIRGRLSFHVSVDDFGYLWVNGESKGHFPWDGEFELTSDARPRQRFLIAIKAVNTGGPLRLLRAEIAAEELRHVRRLIEDVSLSLRTGQKLLSFDTYQTSSSKRVDPGIDRSRMDRAEKKRLNDLLQEVAGGMDLRPLTEGPIERFEQSLREVRLRLKSVADFARRFTLSFNSNAHIDAAWLWREKETIEVCKNTFSSVLTMFEARPDFTFAQSAAAYYDWMERFYPELFQRIARQVAAGRWEVVGGMWVEPDCNLPSGESWARHLLYAKRYFRKKLGVEVKIGWNPDSFGYHWNMPQFYRNAGIDAFVTQKIGWNDTNVFPYRLFWWESPDGSRILSYFPFDYVNEVKNPFLLVDWLRQFEANTGLTTMMVLFGVGDHGGGPSPEMLERIDRLKNIDIFPTIEFANTGDYLRRIRQGDLSTLPVWRDELYLEYHQGTFTTQAKMKKYNREGEVLVTNAERFAALSTLRGGPYSGPALEEAWRKLLFTQFHDILPGSSIREVYVDATETHHELQEIGNHLLHTALRSIADDVNTSAISGVPVIVFNPLSWERTDIVRLELPRHDTASYVVFDARGEPVPSQIVQVDRFQRNIIFRAEGVPSLGYRTYALRPGAAKTFGSSLIIGRSELESANFRIQVDPDSGWVKSIFDKRMGKELLEGYGNELQVLADYPTAWDAWNVGLTGVRYPTRFRSVEVEERGPVRAVLRIRHDFLKPGVRKSYPTEDFPSSFFVQDIILYEGIDRIDFVVRADWWEEKTFLKVAFPLTVRDTVATYEIPFGTIQRSTRMRDSWERAKVEVPAHRWADVSQGDYGASLINNSKYGYDIKGNTIRLSLLRSPKWPDPTADRGKHTVEYALYPHSGSWQAGGTVRRGYEFNYPLLPVVTVTHGGSLPVEHSFVELGPANLVLTTIKKAEDSDAWVIQWYDAFGVDSKARLRLPRSAKRAVRSNFLEEEGEAIPVRGSIIEMPTARHAVTTVKVYF